MTKFAMKTCEVSRNRLTKIYKKSNMLSTKFPMNIVVQKVPKWCLNCGFQCEHSNEEFCTDCLEVIHKSFKDKIRCPDKSDPMDSVMWDNLDEVMTHVYNDKGSIKPIEIEGPLFTSPTVPILHEMLPYSKQNCSIPSSCERTKENQKRVLKTVFLKKGPGIYPIVVPIPNDSMAIGNGNIVKVCRVRPLIQDLEYQRSEEPVKRGRGRPRIHPLKTNKGCEVKRLCARPRIYPFVSQYNNPCENISEKVRKGLGRPRIRPVVETKHVENGDIKENVCGQLKRGRGRPRIHPIVPPQGGMELDVEQNPENFKRGRGRPRKYPRYDEPDTSTEY